MSDILDLDGWTLLARTQEYGWDVLDAEYRPQPTACPKCGTIGHLYRHGTKPTTYLDIPLRGAPARLRAKVQRYRCRSCEETFLQPLGGIRDDRRMTERCAAFIQANCLRDTFVRIAEDVGCDDKTVRSLAAEYMASLDASYRPQLPEWLGVDETQIAGEMLACVEKAAQAQEAAPAEQGEPNGWRCIEEDAEVDVPLDTDLLLAWWDEWSEAWKIEANYAGSERGGWRHGRATHWMPLPAPPSAVQQKGASNG